MNQDVIYRALRGEASPEELEQVERWYMEDPEEFQRCADEAHLQIDMMELYGEQMRPTSWIVTHWKRVARMALQAAAMLAVGLFIGGYVGRERTYELFSEQTNTLQAPNGQRLKLTLPDGTGVQLNSGSVIEYPSVFGKDVRRIRLSGEAMFDVTHNEEQPFVVETFASDIRVLGTRFNVVANEKRRRFPTALFEGRVRITNKLDPTQKEIVLNPNDVANLSNGHLFVEPITDPEITCWTEGLVSISGLPFDELMEKFEQAFDVKIRIELETLPDIRNVSGKIRVNDGIDKALRILQYTADFSYRKNPETNVVTIY